MVRSAFIAAVVIFLLPFVIFFFSFEEDEELPIPWENFSHANLLLVASIFFYAVLILCFYFFIPSKTRSVYTASIWLTCHQQECTLELTPPGSRTLTLVFPRTQLETAQAIKTDKAGNFLYVDTTRYEPPSKRSKDKKKYKAGSYKGPDEKGEYKSYRRRVTYLKTE